VVYKEYFNYLHNNTHLHKGIASRVAPINSRDMEGKSNIARWQTGAASNTLRDQIPEMPKNLKFRALNKLHNLTDARKNVNTGEREFLLHRAMGDEEYNNIGNLDLPPMKSSWTPDYLQARHFIDAHKGFKGKTPYDKVVSAWIPESQIHHSPFMVSTYGNKNPYSSEKEIIVNPHKFQEVDVIKHYEGKKSRIKKYEQYFNDLYKAKKPKTEAHHTVPVAENLDWHLRNLDLGWQTIKDIPKKKHIKQHAKEKKGVPDEKRSALYWLQQKNKLKKMSRPNLQFPKLGIERQDPNVHIISTPKQRKRIDLSLASTITPRGEKIDPQNYKQIHGLTPPKKVHGAVSSYDLNDMVNEPNPSKQLKPKVQEHVIGLISQGKGNKAFGRAYAGKLMHKLPPVSPSQQVVRDRSLESTKQHEALHLLFHNIRHKHGNDLANKIHEHLINYIPEDTRNSLRSYLKNRGYNSKDNNMMQEEMLAHTLSLLTDPVEREKFSRDLSPEQTKNHINNLKGSWNKITQAAKLIDQRFGK